MVCYCICWGFDLDNWERESRMWFYEWTFRSLYESTSTCLVLLWWIGSFAVEMEDWLSQSTFVGTFCSICDSDINFLNQKPSQRPCATDCSSLCTIPSYKQLLLTFPTYWIFPNEGTKPSSWLLSIRILPILHMHRSLGFLMSYIQKYTYAWWTFIKVSQDLV